MPIEIRQIGGARQITGHFPYNETATLADRGRIRKEMFASGAFNFAISNQARRIDLLIGHDFGKPIANRQGGTLAITDNAAGVDFVADLPLPDLTPSWVTDIEKSILAGLSIGLSPGFRVPPPGAVPNAERLIPEPGSTEGVQIRVISEAVLREFSVVTAGAYETAGVELRAEDMDWEEKESGMLIPGALTLWL